MMDPTSLGLDTLDFIILFHPKNPYPLKSSIAKHIR